VVEATPEVVVEAAPEAVVEAAPEVAVEAAPEVVAEAAPVVAKTANKRAPRRARGKPAIKAEAPKAAVELPQSVIDQQEKQKADRAKRNEEAKPRRSRGQSRVKNDPRASKQESTDNTGTISNEKTETVNLSE